MELFDQRVLRQCTFSEHYDKLAVLCDVLSRHPEEMVLHLTLKIEGCSRVFSHIRIEPLL